MEVVSAHITQLGSRSKMWIWVVQVQDPMFLATLRHIYVTYQIIKLDLMRTLKRKKLT
jgi:hypothetical protein